MNTAHPRYMPGLSAGEKAVRIAKAEGHLGTNRDYLFRTVVALTNAGVSDLYLDDIHGRVRDIIETQQGAPA